jgi:hypothetical protein
MSRAWTGTEEGGTQLIVTQSLGAFRHDGVRLLAGAGYLFLAHAAHELPNLPTVFELGQSASRTPQKAVAAPIQDNLRSTRDQRRVSRLSTESVPGPKMNSITSMHKYVNSSAPTKSNRP